MVLIKFLKLNELDTSTSTATPPAACATFFAFSICISATITLAPSLANFLTIPDPKPDPHLLQNIYLNIQKDLCLGLRLCLDLVQIINHHNLVHLSFFE